MNWPEIQSAIRTCQRCEDKPVPNIRVPCREKRKPPYDPRPPIRLYFVSVAPPSGGAYFWDETQRDAVRDGLFSALSKSMGIEVENCREFLAAQLFLTPAVKCPSEKNGNDHKPSRFAVKNCSRFLHSELLVAKPERILALGRDPFYALRDIFGLEAPRNVGSLRKRTWWVPIGQTEVPLSGTFFPGNNRHKGFQFIVEDIARILKLEPKDRA